MGTLLVYLLLAITPAAAFWVARVGLERYVRGPRVHGELFAAERPLERLVADLRRLEQDHARTSRADVPGRTSRLRAIALAYDETLHECCRAVGLPEPSRPPLTALGRLETEAALAQAGVTW